MGGGGAVICPEINGPQDGKAALVFRSWLTSEKYAVRRKIKYVEALVDMAG